MATLTKNWNDGGSLSASYNGVGNDSISISSDINEGIDREMGIKIKDISNTVSVERIVRQYGRREEFYGSDGEFSIANGGTFNVIK